MRSPMPKLAGAQKGTPQRAGNETRDTLKAIGDGL